MEKLRFDVSVPEFNKLPFVIAYRGYIVKWYESYCNCFVFHMNAPKSVYDEIDDLREECIEIIK